MNMARLKEYYKRRSSGSDEKIRLQKCHADSEA